MLGLARTETIVDTTYSMYVQVLTISRTPINAHPFHRLYLHRQITADVRKRRASVVDVNNTSEIMVAGGW